MNITESVTWKVCGFEQLTLRELYLLAKLRVDVFVVEQSCPYPELDGQDLLDDTIHIIGALNGSPVAYARILAPAPTDATSVNTRKPTVYIGRVVIESNHRGYGLASILMRLALAQCEHHYPSHNQALAAQVEVQMLYTKLGFTACSAHYLEDGIAHVDMVRAVHKP
ncbi:MAG: GNAT family N-acetyltransferase [Granulosicoccus sp.]